MIKLTTPPKSRKSYYPHLIEKAVEAQMGKNLGGGKKELLTPVE